MALTSITDNESFDDDLDKRPNQGFQVLVLLQFMDTWSRSFVSLIKFH